MARGGGRGLFEGTFRFGTDSDEDKRDGDEPDIDLMVGFISPNGPLLVGVGCILKITFKSYSFIFIVLEIVTI